MTKQITPLRLSMLDDMVLSNMSPATQRLYINAVKNFSVFFGRSPDKLTFADVRTYQLHLVSRGLKPTTIHPILYALRFFSRTTLGRSGVTEQISPPRRPDPLPTVLAPEEIVRFLKAVHRASADARPAQAGGSSHRLPPGSPRPVTASPPADHRGDRGQGRNARV